MNYRIFLFFACAVFTFVACGPQYNENPAVVIEDAVVDIDSNHYDAVKIGDQVWMASNLRTTRYADGTKIHDGTGQSSDTAAFRYAPAGNDDFVTQYGYLYNWSAVMHDDTLSENPFDVVQGICPDGWHVPSPDEWRTMTKYVSQDDDYMHVSLSVGKALASSIGWDTTHLMNTPGRDKRLNNATGFSALPAGCFTFGEFNDLGKYAYFWTTKHTSAYFVGGYTIGYNRPDANSMEYSLFYGLSVRCVQDEKR